MPVASFEKILEHKFLDNGDEIIHFMQIKSVANIDSDLPDDGARVQQQTDQPFRIIAEHQNIKIHIQINAFRPVRNNRVISATGE